MSNSIQIILNDDEGVMFKVNSSTRDIEYLVNVFYDGRGWYCGCEDHHFRKHDCKHIRACQELINYGV